MVETKSCIKNTDIILMRSRKRMKQLREERGISKNQLAKDTEFSPTSIENWESGIKTPSYQNYLRLSVYYDVSFEYISGIEPDEIRHKENIDICKKTHLSEQAIENILYEGSEKGDNQRIFILDLILSNKEVFNSIMDDLIALFYPPTLAIDRRNPPSVFLDKKNKDYLLLSLDHLSKLIVTPEEHYQRMKYRIEQIKESAPDSIIAPNEFNPF